MNSPLLLTVLTSSLVSGCVTALITGVYGLRARQNEYVNDYYKIIIQRRVAAYEQLEQLILPLKTAVVDDDRKPYHFLFANDDTLSAHTRFFALSTHALWLSDEALTKTRELHILMVGLETGSAIDFGKRHYEQIATIRHELERILARDMRTLHKVDRFLKAKDATDPGFKAINLPLSHDGSPDDSQK